ncbi:Baseplate J-like protein [compost metagenome]
MDFEDFATLVPGVHAAKCEETYNETSDVHLYIATVDGTPPTTALKNHVKAVIEDVMIMNQNLHVFDAVYVDYAITVNVNILAGVSNAEMKRKIEELLTASYGPTSYGFGDTIYVSQIVSTIFRSDNNILNVVVSSPAADIETESTEIPRMNSYTVNVTGGI